MDETIDIVNDEDQVIGQATRKEAHQQGLKHRSSHLIIYNKNHEIFLQQRSQQKDKFPGKWDSSVAGHVDCNESYEKCVQRECLEEVGAVVNETLEIIAKIPPSDTNGHEFITVFAMCYEGPFTLNTHEVDAGRWYQIATVKQMLQANANQFAGGFKEVFDTFLLAQRKQ